MTLCYVYLYCIFCAQKVICILLLHVIQYCFCIISKGSQMLFQNLHAANAVSWKKCVQPNRRLNTLTTIFWRTILHYLFRILPVVPTAELCASPTDNSTTFGIFELGPHPWQPSFTTSAWLDLRLSLVLPDSWLVCLPSRVGSLLSTHSELEAGTINNHDFEKYKSKFSVLSFTFCWDAICGQSRKQMNGRNRHRQ